MAASQPAYKQRNFLMGSRTVAITPSDSTTFDPPLKAIWVGATGTLVLKGADDTAAVTFAAVPVGRFDGLLISKVMAATTATNLMGIY